VSVPRSFAPPDEPVGVFLTICVALKKPCLSFTFPQHPPPSLTPPDLQATNMSHRGDQRRSQRFRSPLFHPPSPHFLSADSTVHISYQYEAQLSSTASLLPRRVRLSLGEVERLNQELGAHVSKFEVLVSIVMMVFEKLNIVVKEARCDQRKIR